MIKLLKLNFNVSVKKEKLVFALLYIGIMISTITLFYSFGEINNSVMIMQDEDRECRVFTATGSNLIEFKNVSNKVEEIVKKYPDIENIKLILEDGVTFSYYHSLDYTISYGNGFSGNSEPEIILGTFLEQENDVGDLYSVGNDEFSVVGKRVLSNFNEVNYNGLNSNTIISGMEIGISSIPKREDAERLMVSFSEILDEWELTPPTDFNFLGSYIGNDKLYLSIALVLMSLVNISFLYRYLLVKRKNTYAIYQICGCSKLSCIFLIFSELILITIFPFIIGVLLYKFVIEGILLNQWTYTTRIGLGYICKVGLLFFILMLTVFSPFIFKFSKQTPKEIRYSNVK